MEILTKFGREVEEEGCRKGGLSFFASVPVAPLTLLLLLKKLKVEFLCTKKMCMCYWEGRLIFRYILCARPG